VTPALGLVAGPVVDPDPDPPADPPRGLIAGPVDLAESFPFGPAAALARGLNEGPGAGWPAVTGPLDLAADLF
jgi:hypothetical protein